MGEEKRTSGWIALSSKSGCKHLFLILVAAILLFSFCAQMVATAGGRIKIEQISIDSRGAVLSADLYYPAGTSDQDNLPGIIVSHGAGVNNGNYKSIAEELARRGFVVMNVNGYGTSGSEMPPYDEYDQGQDAFNMWGTCSGIYDALQFLRTFNFVDQTRLGLVGHSQGSFRAEFASLIDCSYMTFNDLMINILYDKFGQTFTEEEILMDASQLAQARLNSDQLKYYEYLSAETRQWYDTRVSTILILGTSGKHLVPRQAVSVGGHEVMRNCQINLSIMCGTYDSTAFVTNDYALDSFFVENKIETDTWYAVDDVHECSTIVGTIDDSVSSNTALLDAVNNRQARFVTYNRETHSKNFLSVQTTSDIVRFCEQTLKYNCGDLESPGTRPIDAFNSIFAWREAFNFLAMCAMIAMLAPLAGLLYHSEFFAPCMGSKPINTNQFSKKRYWITSIVSAVISFICMFWLNTIFAPFLPCNDTFPLWPGFWLGPIFLLMFAGFSAVQIVVYSIIDKKKYGSTFLSSTNFMMGFVNILKTLLAAVIIILTAYATLVVVKYLFNQDYRLWMFVFTDLKVEYWGYVLKLAAFSFIQFIPIGIALNYAHRPDIPGWLDDLLTVVFGSLGVWLLAIVNILVLHAGGAAISNWQFSYQFLLAVPVTIYVARKLYKVTHSVWLGAFVNALLLGWSFVGPAGYNIYHAQSIISTFFNF